MWKYKLLHCKFQNLKVLHSSFFHCVSKSKWSDKIPYINKSFFMFSQKLVKSYMEQWEYENVWSPWAIIKNFLTNLDLSAHLFTQSTMVNNKNLPHLLMFGHNLANCCQTSNSKIIESIHNAKLGYKHNLICSGSMSTVIQDMKTVRLGSGWTEKLALSWSSLLQYKHHIIVHFMWLYSLFSRTK